MLKMNLLKMKPPHHQARGMRAVVFGSLVLLGALCPSLAAEPPSETETLLETGAAKKPRAAQPAPASLKIVSYNIRWRGGEDLRRLTALLKDDREIGGASIIGLQEVDRNKKRTGNINTARLMAEELGMYYAWAAPPPAAGSKENPQEEETGVAILSLYPLTDVTRIVLPYEGPGGRRRVALGATARVGAANVRIYSVHGETRIGVRQKLEQFRAVLNDLAQHQKAERAVVLGDFNTWERSAVPDTTRLFIEAGFSTPFPDNLTTWKTFFVELKLDWLWLRGLSATAYGVDKKVGFSDHWPLWVTVTTGESDRAKGERKQ
ncbi:MAG TPA: endonuclease/exonuclease/phosphatase family protein [Pyrinomonadaceae bacterium]|jgi:endonuclease/exonuclease/phosphatase family metal-dependent hydrolase